MLATRLSLTSILISSIFLPLAGLAAPPPVRVVVFDDAAYVDTTSGGTSAESDNVQATLGSLAFTVTTFTGVTDTAWRNATSTADVLLVPDLEVADLAAALDENGEQAILDFVAAGGVLIVQGNAASRQTGLINAVFGFATSSVAGAIADLEDTATGTRFVQGPASLALNNSTVGFAGLPASTHYIYVSPAHVATLVSIPFGAGKVICMGWDWFNAAPIGALDGGWVEALRRAVLEGRPPTRRIAVLDDPSFVDSAGGLGAESDTLQAALDNQDMLVTPFFGVTEIFFATQLGDPRRPRTDVLAIPEQQVAELAPALDALTLGRIRDYVGTGGVLLVVGGSFPGRAASLLNTTFGFATSAGVSVVNASALTDTAGTVFAGAPASLSSPSDTSTLLGLPVGSQRIYAVAGNATVALIPYRQGRIVYVGWDLFNAAPLGAVDDGWIGVLARAARTSAPARRVAVFNDPAYVDSTEAPADATAASTEALNMRASLALRGHVPRPFAGVTQPAWSAALAGADALVVPDLEVADITPDLSAAIRAEIVSFVRRGGLLVVPIGQSARGLGFVNTLFGTAMTASSPAGPYPAAPTRLGTPFETGPASLTQNNATANATSLPAGARALYGAGNDAPAVWLQVGAGHVLVLGWDWFDAISGGGTLDGGWVDTLDLAVQATRPRARRVAVFDNPAYVDTAGLTTSESDNVQAALASLDHPVLTFAQSDAASLRELTANADALLIPELEIASLAPAINTEAAKELRDFVDSGGALLVHGTSSSRTSILLNSLFGWTLSNPVGVTTPPISVDATGVLGTRFAGVPGSVGVNEGIIRLSGLPFGGRSIFTDAGGASVVAWIPYGLGRVVYLGWDFFEAAPVSSQDAGWLDVLDRAVQEARPRTRAVAVAHNPAWVDIGLGDESDNLQRGLESVGALPTNRSFYLPQTQAVVIPELEQGPFTGGDQELRDYVSRGGVLVLSLDDFGRAASLLNGAFGLAVAVAGSGEPVFVPAPGVAGTPFAGGPAQLLNLPTVHVLTSSPANARRIYDDGDGGNLVVAALPYGAGQVVVVGWDFFGEHPYAASDNGQGAWFEVLRRALELAPPAARGVAVFDDPLYVDTAGGSSAESDTVQASLLRLEHAVVPFTGIAQADFASALTRADVLLVPELAVDLAPALTVAARNEINAFVNGGGGLVVHGANGRAANLLNTLFGITVTETSAADATYVHAGASAAGTQFAPYFTPPDIAQNSAINGLANGTQPPAARVAYAGPTTSKEVVVVIPRGFGRAVYLGWDWFNAVPLGTADGGWIDVLDRAVREGTGGDADGDGVATSVDLCPFLPNPSQADGDLDGVGDVCDSCTNIANPRVPIGDFDFTFNNTWATLTGAQRDDDHDGYGNKCDAKFPQAAGAAVGTNDLTQFRTAFNKSRASDTCGTSGTKPCAIFDLDEGAAAAIGTGDLTQFRTLFNKLPGPKCAACPQPCKSGNTGTCN